MKKWFIITIISSIVGTNANAQVFELDSTYFNGQMYTSEIILHGIYKYIGTRSSLSRFQLNNSPNWGYGITSSWGCLHNESRFKDLELLSNGSLAGIFYHDESCITPESAFVMLDSNGNVLVDKRFAKGIPLFNGGIIEHNDSVHLYAIHALPSPTYRGWVHYTFDLQGNQLDSVTRLDSNLAWGSYTGFDGFRSVQDSLLVHVGQYSLNNPYEYQIAMADFEMNPEYRIIYSDTLNSIQEWKKYDNKIALVLRKINFGGYRAAFGLVNTDGSNVRVDTSILGPSIEYGDLIQMKDYYVLTEYSPIPGNAYHNLIIYDSTLNIVNRQPVSHKGGLFIKTSDSTFVLYDETWTYQYTMNFDSIPGYVTGIDEYINKPVAELDVKIYPNPTTGQLTVQFPKSKKTMVKLFTISGMEIAQKQVLNTTETSFDLSPFPKGLYLIRVNSEFGSQTVKVLKK